MITNVEYRPIIPTKKTIIKDKIITIICMIIGSFIGSFIGILLAQIF